MESQNKTTITEEQAKQRLYKIKSRVAKDNFIIKMIKEHGIYL